MSVLLRDGRVVGTLDMVLGLKGVYGAGMFCIMAEFKLTMLPVLLAAVNSAGICVNGGGI